jgi:GT2 family glycosyltransferase
VNTNFRVTVLLALFNRVEKTRRCIESFLNEKPENWDVSISIVDDNSSDETRAYLNSLKSRIKINILDGPGNWYWAKSMRQAELAINWDYDAILWLNNDIEFIQGQLSNVEFIRGQFPRSILVGQFCDPRDFVGTYGGYWRESRNPLKYKREFIFTSSLAADTFNGNFVIIPYSCALMIGGIDGEFAHGYADCDYGLRARELGLDVRIIPNFLGYCERNEISEKLSLFEELKSFSEKKNNPLRSQIRFFRRHGGIEWPIYLVSPYFRIITKRFISQLRSIGLTK